MGGVWGPLNSRSYQIHRAGEGGRLLIECLPLGPVLPRGWATAVLYPRCNGVLYPPDGLFAHSWARTRLLGYWRFSLFIVWYDLTFLFPRRTLSLKIIVILICYLVLTLSAGALAPVVVCMAVVS